MRWPTDSWVSAEITEFVDAQDVMVILGISFSRAVENTMGTKNKPEIPLPKGWRRHVRSAILHVISLALYATAYTRSWALDKAAASHKPA